MEPILTKEEADKKMKARGYERVSVNMAGDVVAKTNYVKHIKDIPLHATVNLINANITLEFVELKLFAKLSMTNFAFEHPEFEKFEGVMVTYIAKCLDIDVMETLNDFLGHKDEPEEIAPKPPKKTIAEKKAEFWAKVKVEGKAKGLSKEVCEAFYRYWTEVNDGGNKLRWEIIKTKSGTFSIKGRLVTWIGNNKVFDAKFKDKVEKKVEVQNTKAREWQRNKTNNEF